MAIWFSAVAIVFAETCSHFCFGICSMLGYTHMSCRYADGLFSCVLGSTLSWHCLDSLNKVERCLCSTHCSKRVYKNILTKHEHNILQSCVKPRYWNKGFYREQSHSDSKDIPNGTFPKRFQRDSKGNHPTVIPSGFQREPSHSDSKGIPKALIPERF